ncbi:MAG: response regulator [Opitutus sp.]
MNLTPDLFQEFLRYRVDVVILIALALAAGFAAKRFPAARHAGRDLSTRIWLVTLGPVALGAILAEWVTIALAYPDLASASTVILGRIALLGAFGAVSALLLVDTVQLATLRAELHANDDARRRIPPQDALGADAAAATVASLTRATQSLESMPPQGDPAATVTHRPRVLVVDDMETNRFLLEIYLRRNGFEPHLASGGREAVRLAAAIHYDAILMDVQMPDIDGCTATREIRAAEAPGRRTLIFALTAAVTPETRERCLTAGMDEYLTKPIDLHRFKTLLKQLPGR